MDKDNLRLYTIELFEDQKIELLKYLSEEIIVVNEAKRYIHTIEKEIENIKDNPEFSFNKYLVFNKYYYCLRTKYKYPYIELTELK